MSIHVTSEVAPLKKVLLHRPGAELEHLAPREMELFLLDDIPYLRTARREHDELAGILQAHGAEVVYLEDLLAEVLKDHPERKRQFISRVIDEGGGAAHRYREQLTAYLSGIPDERDLILKTMAGVSVSELREDLHSPLVDLLQPKHRFLLDPIPNLYFTRDPFSSIGQSVSLNHMYSVTRRRETLYGEFLLRYHPDLNPGRPLYYRRTDPFTIEGGDIFNLSERVLAVGISQRTEPGAVELLAHNVFADETSRVDTILAFDIPSIRAFMHLDTVFTQADHDKFVVHPGVLNALRVFRLTPGAGSVSLKAEELTAPLDVILAEALGLDRVTLIRCGGSDRIASEREQWNDASNTLCIAPGTVIVYDRNNVTNRILSDHGIRVLEMPSSELSRGRGGPRCMTMPLIRD